MHELDVSVNICTYNRCGILSEALEGVLSQQIPDGRRYEVIVVDNNSTDETRQVVESFAARGHENLRYCSRADRDCLMPATPPSLRPVLQSWRSPTTTSA